MRMTERLTGLKSWVERELCTGRMMKAPASNMNIGEIVKQEPRCYLAWAPARMDSTGRVREDPVSVCPGIIIMPRQAYAKYTEEKRFDRFNNVHRPQDMGQHLHVDMLFSVYEPGVRLKGFVNSMDEKGQGLDMSLIQEGTEQGFLTLMNWMDDCLHKLLGQMIIPNTDLMVEETSLTYSLYTDQQYVTDRRPIYYGFVTVSFMCYANKEFNKTVEAMLK